LIRHRGSLLLGLVLSCAGLGGCSDDPVYIASMPPALDFVPTNNPDPDAGVPTIDLRVPMSMDTTTDDAKRMEIATRLGLTLDEIPTVRRDDTDLEIEYSIKNMGDQDTTATLAVNGANEFFRYDNGGIIRAVVDDEEDPPPPSLLGGRPIPVAAGQTVSGVLREDQLSDAAQDLDAMSRGGFNYTKAILDRWTSKDISGGMGGEMDFIPSEAIPLLIDLVVTISANQPLHMTANLRVRDRSDRLRVAETDTAKLVAPSDVLFQPPAAPTDGD
jgi:hypothetical protein